MARRAPSGGLLIEPPQIQVSGIPEILQRSWMSWRTSWMTFSGKPNFAMSPQYVSSSPGPEPSTD